MFKRLLSPGSKLYLVLPSHQLEHRRRPALASFRHFVWSLWNGWHLVNLFDLSHGLDGTLTDGDLLIEAKPAINFGLEYIGK